MKGVCLLLVAVALTAGAVGCTHCDTCDDFPTPCVGGNCGYSSSAPSMGYGGTSEGAGRAIGKSGDDGVDGVIDQDPLGVDQIYIQAKRYQAANSIGAAAVRDFFGAFSLKRATKGSIPFPSLTGGSDEPPIDTR